MVEEHIKMELPEFSSVFLVILRVCSCNNVVIPFFPDFFFFTFDSCLSLILVHFKASPLVKERAEASSFQRSEKYISAPCQHLLHLKPHLCYR